MTKKLDKETEKVFTVGEKLKSLTENHGWPIVREMLIKKAAQQLNLSDIGTDSANHADIVLQIGIRQETAKALLSWLQEIEGTVEMHAANIDSFAEVKDEYIIQVDEER